MRSLASLFELYPQARTIGLTESQTSDSRGRFGVNKLTPLPKEPV